MTFGRAQSRTAASPLRALTQAQLFAVLVSGLLAFVMLELLPCSGGTCFGMTRESATPSSTHALSIAPVSPTSDVPTSLPAHQPECALHHAHCSALIASALSFGAVLTLVALLSAGPPLSFPTWMVAPPLPPP
jgi:hypothetical protein